MSRRRVRTPGTRDSRRGVWEVHNPEGGEEERSPAELRAIARTALAEMRRGLDAYDAFDTLAAIFLEANLVNPDTWSEEDRPPPVLPELAALSILGRPTGRDAVGSDYAVVRRDVIRDTLSLGTAALDAALQAMAVERQRAGIASGASSLRFHSMGREMVFRVPGYPAFEKLHLQGLFGPSHIDAALRSYVGVGIRDVIQMCEAIIDIPNTRIGRQRQNAQSAYRAITGPRRRPTAALRRAGREAGDAAYYRDIQSVMTFTAGQLAESVGVDIAAASALLALVTTPFAPADIDETLLVRNPFHARPIITDGDGTYICITGHDLWWAVRPALELALKSHAEARRAYERHRGRYCEERATTLLRQILRPDRYFSQFHYLVNEVPVEGDGLFVVGNAALIMEAKSAPLSAPSRRGDTVRLTKELRDLVSKGSEQARRLRQLIETTHSVTVVRDAESEQVDLSDIAHTPHIIVTLDQLQLLLTRPGDVVDAGLVSDGARPPVVVSLQDLEVIADLVQYPAQFVDYVVRREIVNRMDHLTAGEELDYFLAHQEMGLPEAMLEETREYNIALIPSQTSRLTQYHLYREGVRRKRTRKPTLNLHPSIVRLLDKLERVRPEGWLDASLMLLNVIGHKGGGPIVRVLSGAERRSSADSPISALSLQVPFPHGAGMTVAVALPSVADDLKEVLTEASVVSKYQARAEVWVGFGRWKGHREPYVVYLYSRRAWEHDDDLDEIAQVALQAEGRVSVAPTWAGFEAEST
jgi:hypothetical protein